MEDENRRNGGMFESSLSTGLAASSLLVSVPGFSLLNFIVKNIGEETGNHQPTLPMKVIGIG